MKKKSLFLLLILFAFSNIIAAQNLNIEGVITDKNTNEPLIGATVLEKGTNNGTITNFDGHFEISAPRNSVLVISYIGYIAQEITVTNQTNLKIQMTPDTELLEEVVVVGYGTKKAGAITGSVVQVKSAEILKSPAMSAVQSIQGKAVGVNVISTDEPGKSPSVMIRGIGTVLGGRTPLYVIDGVEASSLNGLSSNDIATIDILKDASSLAIYGNKAGSGVILITTKKGNNGTIKVNYDGNVSFKSIMKPIDMADAYRFAYYQNFAVGRSKYSLTQPYDTNWMDEITRTGITTNNSISLSGGQENVNYYFGFSNFIDKGILLGNDYSRNNIISKNEYFLFDKKLKIIQTFNISSTNNTPQPLSAFTAAYKQAPIMPVKYENGKWGMPFLNTETGTIDVQGEKFNNVPNPVTMLNFDIEQNKTLTLFGNVGAELKVTKNIKFNSNFGGTYYSEQGYTYTPNEENWYSQNPNGTPFGNKYYSTLQQRTKNYFIWNWDNFATYTNKFGNHEVTGVLGMTRSTARADHYLSSTRYDVPPQSNYWALDLSKNNLVQTPNIIISNNNQTPLVNLGYFIRADYSYENKYLVTASLRRDGISDFQGANKWGYFPSISGGWVASSEPFFESISHTIDYLKVRIGYGEIGNGNACPSVNQVLFQNGASYPFGIDETIYPGSYVPYAVDPNLTWETTIELDAGIDFQILGQKLVGTLDLYNRKTDNVILPVKLPTVLSPDPVYLNAGAVENKGIETSLTWKDKIGKSFNYRIGGNFAFNKNEVTEIYSPFFDKLTGGDLGNGQYTKEIHKGDPIGSFYVYQVTGFTDAGSFTYSPTRIFAGSYIPKYTYGFNFGFDYKNFEFSADFYGVGGNKVFNGKKAQRFGGENIERSELVNFWNPSNMNPNADNPHPFSETPRASTYYIENGAYLRINNLTLAYTLPKFVKQIEKIRVFVTAVNPLILTGYSGFSPELSGEDNGNPLSTAGIELNAYPTNKSITCGLSIGL